MKLRAAARWAACWLLLASAPLGCGDSPAPAPDERWLRLPADFPPLPASADNELSAERVALGKQLFFDKRLSRTQEVACATCHVQSAGFSDPNRLSTGVEGRIGTRNAPALVNLAWAQSFFWDGGVPSLELQVIGPIQNPLEMDSLLSDVAARLATDAPLVAAFELAYGEGPSEFTITRAIAAFERTLISGESPYDRYRRGEAAALDAAQERGRALFFGEEGECFHCHNGLDLTTGGFRNNGIAIDDPDPGRSALTGRELDRGKFKVPTLRNIAVSAPYMHDGSIATLAEVVAMYNAGGRGHPNTDPLILPLGLTDAEQADLVRFLESLTDEAFLTDPRFAAPVGEK